MVSSSSSFVPSSSVRRGLVLAALVAVLGLTGACGAGTPGVTVPGIDTAAAAGGPTGEVPESGISPFDDSNPAIARLDPALRAALQRASADARTDGVTIHVTSGWRSPEYQEQLLQQAIRDHGSLAEARKWVSSPQQSKHVKGEAVDVGPTDAGSWMDQHGAAYGLCRRYANELWHYELLTTPGGQCPAQLADATEG